MMQTIAIFVCANLIGEDGVTERTGDSNRPVDIWLAKDLEWLPGRIRSQESNGRVLELVFKQKTSIN